MQKTTLIIMAISSNIIIGCNPNATSPIFFSTSSMPISDQEFKVSLVAPGLKRATANFSRYGKVDEELVEQGEWRNTSDSVRMAYLELNEYNGTGYYITESSLDHTFRRSLTNFATQANEVSNDRIIKTGRGITRYKMYTYKSRNCFGFQRYYTTSRKTPGHVVGDAHFFGYYCAQKDDKLTDEEAKEIILSINYKGKIVR